MNKGYIHIYTGNGKGKTTAAFGLAIRAALAGKNVFIGQFIKGMKYNETKIEKHIENIIIKQFGKTCFIDRTPSEQDIKLAQQGLNLCKELICTKKYLNKINKNNNFNYYSNENKNYSFSNNNINNINNKENNKLFQNFDIIILDELTIAIYFNLLNEKEVIEMLKNKKENVEIVITGRKATDKLIEVADLVTEMKEIKHYYKKGITAREGIEY